MLLSVYVDTPEDFARWLNSQKQTAVQDPSVADGRRVFETTACLNCHAISGTNGNDAINAVPTPR